MMSTAATAEELREILDGVDDLVIERIAATGATLDEVGEAIDDLDASQRVPSSGRVVEVRRILAEATAADADRAPILR